MADIVFITALFRLQNYYKHLEYTNVFGENGVFFLKRGGRGKS